MLKFIGALVVAFVISVGVATTAKWLNEKRANKEEGKSE